MNAYIPQAPRLHDQNREILARYLQPLPYDVCQSVLGTLQENYESTVNPSPPVKGSIAPDFTLIDQHGEPHTLSEQCKPIVLSFYRGGWCEHCTFALNGLKRRQAAISVFGGKILAISPEQPYRAIKTAKRHRLPFALLFDEGNQIADHYGLRWSIAPLLEPIYQAQGLEIPDVFDRLDVPYPATFIVNADRLIAETFINRDPCVRMEPDNIAGVIRKMVRGPNEER